MDDQKIPYLVPVSDPYAILTTGNSSPKSFRTSTRRHEILSMARGVRCGELAGLASSGLHRSRDIRDLEPLARGASGPDLSTGLPARGRRLSSEKN